MIAADLIPVTKLSKRFGCSPETLVRRAQRAGVVLVDCNPGGRYRKWAIAEHDVARLVATPTPKAAPMIHGRRPVSLEEVAARSRAMR